MSSLDPIEGVSGNSSINPYDPSNYSASSSQDSTIQGMENSLGMDKEQEEKFESNLYNFLTQENKHDTDNLIAKMKEETQAVTQV
jgi:hypothetical protein